MSSEADDIEAMQRAKKALHEKYGKCAWFRGVGIAPSKSGLVLRLNVDPNVKVAKDEIPHSYQGIKVNIVRIGSYKPRHDA